MVKRKELQMNLAEFMKSCIPCISSYKEESAYRSMETRFSLQVSEGTTLKTVLAQSMAFLSGQLAVEDSKVIDFLVNPTSVWIRFKDNEFAYSHNVFVISVINDELSGSVSHQKFRKPKQI
jgi:hypothetical protein